VDWSTVPGENGGDLEVEKITDKTWMTWFNLTNVPGVVGNGRYYCQNDGSFDFTTDPDGPWNPSIQRTWGKDGQGHNSDELWNAYNYVQQGYALALSQ
jgi:hypothetical protein